MGSETSRTTRTATWLCAVALAMGSCAIQEDAVPQVIPDSERGLLGDRPSGDIAAGNNRIFLLTAGAGDEQQRLRSVLRAGPSDPEAILQSLLAGPNLAEQQNQLISDLPDGLRLEGARQRGPLLTVDVSDGFGELRPESLRIAVAQIVATATEIDGVQRVRLRINGENRAWPLGDGEATDRVLTLYDYPGLVESSQPAYPATAILATTES